MNQDSETKQVPATDVSFEFNRQSLTVGLQSIDSTASIKGPIKV